MARVLTRCPTRGQIVFTGHWMNTAKLDALGGEHAFRCQTCGEIHRWTRPDVWVEGAEIGASAGAT